MRLSRGTLEQWRASEREYVGHKAMTYVVLLFTLPFLIPVVFVSTERKLAILARQVATNTDQAYSEWARAGRQ